MAFSQIDVAIESGLATITLMRPDALNALSPTLFVDLADALETMPATVRVVVLAATGRAFSAGADLKVLRDPGFGREEGHRFQAAAARAVGLLESVPQVTIARVQGLCLTGGLEVALACDLIVAAEEAVFGDTHAKIGFRPRWGLTQRLPRRIGIMRAREMSFTGRLVSAREAVAIGLALDCVPLDRLDARIAELTDAISANDAHSIATYKMLYTESQNRFLGDGVRFEATARVQRSRA